MTIVEMMRLLVDVYDVQWPVAWQIICDTCSYTNHTLLPEALETWPIVLRAAAAAAPADRLPDQSRFSGDRQRALSERPRPPPSHVADPRGRRPARAMAYLSVIGSHRVNGVAKLHSRLMRETIFADFARAVAGALHQRHQRHPVRRWLKQANPGRRALLTEKARLGVENDLEDLERLKWAADDAEFRQRFRAIKRANKERLATRFISCSASTSRRRDVRRAGQAHPRVQAPAAEPAVRGRALPAHPRRPGRADRAARRDLRRQGRTGLSHGEGRHQAHQQRRRRDQRRTRASATSSSCASCRTTTCRWRRRSCRPPTCRSRSPLPAWKLPAPAT